MDAQWLLWLGLALLAGVIEIFTLSLVFAMVAGGALAAAAVAAVTGDAVASVLAFAVSTGLLFVAVRPPLRRYAERGGPAELTGVAALVGHSAQVVDEVSGRDGRIRLAGEIWTARAQFAGEVLEAGSTVFVTRIDGATAVVTASPPTAALPGGDRPSDRPES